MSKKKSSKKRANTHAFKWFIFCIFIILVFFATIYGVAINGQKKIINDKNTATKIEAFLPPQNKISTYTKEDNISKKEEINATKQEQTLLDINYSKYQNGIQTSHIQQQELAEQNLSEFFKFLDTNDTLENKNKYPKVEENITKESNNTAQIQKQIKKIEDNDLEKKSQKATYDKTAKVINRNGKKPLLAIIIDDVSTASQAELIKKIGLNITPSIFPTSKRTPNTAQIANKFSFYMVHMPMSALNYKNEEPNTLHITDSSDTILKRVINIKNDFPRLKIINNHTGSEFTSNYQSLDKLMNILKSQNLILLDSKTISNSKVQILSQKYNMPYLFRDVFLDNSVTEYEIKSQLRDAIAIAKKRGYAIAIGHPHDVTLKTLQKNKDMLKDVEVIYVDKLYREVYGNFK